jgi:hypothetical protein
MLDAWDDDEIKVYRGRRTRCGIWPLPGWYLAERARERAATMQRFADLCAEAAVDRALPAPKRRAGLPEALRAKLDDESKGAVNGT